MNQAYLHRENMEDVRERLENSVTQSSVETMYDGEDCFITVTQRNKTTGNESKWSFCVDFGTGKVQMLEPTEDEESFGNDNEVFSIIKNFLNGGISREKRFGNKIGSSNKTVVRQGPNLKTLNETPAEHIMKNLDAYKGYTRYDMEELVLKPSGYTLYDSSNNGRDIVYKKHSATKNDDDIILYFRNGELKNAEIKPHGNKIGSSRVIKSSGMYDYYASRYPNAYEKIDRWLGSIQGKVTRSQFRNFLKTELNLKDTVIDDFCDMYEDAEIFSSRKSIKSAKTLCKKGPAKLIEHCEAGEYGYLGRYTIIIDGEEVFNFTAENRREAVCSFNNYLDHKMNNNITNSRKAIKSSLSDVNKALGFTDKDIEEDGKIHITTDFGEFVVDYVNDEYIVTYDGEERIFTEYKDTVEEVVDLFNQLCNEEVEFFDKNINSSKSIKSSKYIVEVGNDEIKFDNIEEANETFRQAVENNDVNTSIKIYVDEGYSNKHLKLMRSERGRLTSSRKSIKSSNKTPYEEGKSAWGFFKSFGTKPENPYETKSYKEGNSDKCKEWNKGFNDAKNKHYNINSSKKPIKSVYDTDTFSQVENAVDDLQNKLSSAGIKIEDVYDDYFEDVRCKVLSTENLNPTVIANMNDILQEYMKSHPNIAIETEVNDYFYGRSIYVLLADEYYIDSSRKPIKSAYFNPEEVFAYLVGGPADMITSDDKVQADNYDVVYYGYGIMDDGEKGHLFIGKYKDIKSYIEDYMGAAVADDYIYSYKINGAPVTESFQYLATNPLPTEKDYQDVVNKLNEYVDKEYSREFGTGSIYHFNMYKGEGTNTDGYGHEYPNYVIFDTEGNLDLFSGDEIVQYIDNLLAEKGWYHEAVSGSDNFTIAVNN